MMPCRECKFDRLRRPDTEVFRASRLWFDRKDLILAPASGLSLFGERRRAAFFSTPEPPDFNADDTLQLTPTHVSPSPFAVVDRSQSPSTERDGPMTWNSNQVRLSQQVTDVREHLTNALRARDQRQALESMKEFDDNSIRDGVDLVIAGMLEHKAVSQSLAQALQDLMLLLIPIAVSRLRRAIGLRGCWTTPRGSLRGSQKTRKKSRQSKQSTECGARIITSFSDSLPPTSSLTRSRVSPTIPKFSTSIQINCRNTWINMHQFALAKRGLDDETASPEKISRL